MLMNDEPSGTWELKWHIARNCGVTEGSRNEGIMQIQSSLVINPSSIRHFDLRPVTFYDHFSL
jgi:hypothetical protein